MKLPVISAKELLAILDKQGFKPVRQHGSHIFLRHPDGRTVCVPDHPGQDIGRGLLRKIVHDMQLTRDEFMKLFNSR